MVNLFLLWSQITVPGSQELCPCRESHVLSLASSNSQISDCSGIPDTRIWCTRYNVARLDSLWSVDLVSCQGIFDVGVQY